MVVHGEAIAMVVEAFLAMGGKRSPFDIMYKVLVTKVTAYVNLSCC